MTFDAKLAMREASEAERQRWDEIVQRFPAWRIVHKRAWIESLETSGLGRPLYLVLERGGEIVGCLPGLLANVGPFRMFGSPMPGWQSVSMGPVFDPARVTPRELTETLVRTLESRYGVDHIEMISGSLDEEAMGAVGFRGEPMVTFRAAMTPDEVQRTFRGMKESARRNVKRGTKLGLTVRLGVDSAFIDDHYAQITAVFARGGNVVPFRKARLAAFVAHMQESGNLIAASVFLPDGSTRIATATFTVDGPELLLWMWAHDVRYRWYRPTEMMTWAIMQAAMERGCTTLDFMGRGDFKAVFGGHPQTEKCRWVRSRRPWITTARDLAGIGFRWQQAVRGRIARMRLDDAPLASPEPSAPGTDAGNGDHPPAPPRGVAVPKAARLPSWSEPTAIVQPGADR